MCNYWHGGTMECRGDGYMWDADADGWDPDDISFPCPACNTRAYLLEAKENGECISFSSSWSGDFTGEEMWLGGVAVALAANPYCAPRILRQIGVARPIVDHPTDRGGCIEMRHDHRQQRILISRNRREFSKRDRL